ncbi:MAG: hypothetical protein M3547_06350 [Acidobacteriota bacterium]|nr:hypothetical protein [Acidobacteriota bacterium]
MPEIGRLFARRAELLRELATLEEELGRVVGLALAPVPAPDAALSLAEAAAFVGEPVESFRRRHDYRRALLTRPGERRLRFSRTALERVLRDRLAGNDSTAR